MTEGQVDPGESPSAGEAVGPRSECRTDEPSTRLLSAEVFEICVQQGGYPDRWKTLDACPVCQSPRRDVCFVKSGFRHVQCRDCGLVSLDCIPPEDVLQKLYQGEYYSKVRELFELPLLKGGGGTTPFSAPEAALKELIENVSRGRGPGVWLDVGGGFGAFADLVRRSLPEWRVVLNDWNPRSLEIAREVLVMETTADDARILDASGRRFDVVSAVAVLEHMPDPLDFLKGYGKLLHPGGVLAIVVPHFTRLSGLVSRASSPAAAPPFHINLFNRQSLVELIRRSGLFQDPETYDRGDTAFSLMHHVDFSEHFDITIPTPADPKPRTFMVKPFDTETSRRINALSAADAVMKEYFAETDGRNHLVAVAVRLEEADRGGRSSVPPFVSA